MCVPGAVTVAEGVAAGGIRSSPAPSRPFGVRYGVDEEPGAVLLHGSGRPESVVVDRSP